MRLEPARPIRMLSVGCSTGEEPFSIAMALKQAPAIGGAEVSITGIDVNPESLERARCGRFDRWSLRATPEHCLKQCFRCDGNDFVLDAKIRAMVRLAEGNLAVESDWWRPEGYEIIFCGNVLMYFTPAKCIESAARLARAVVAGGFLFLGHAGYGCSRSCRSGCAGDNHRVD